MRPRPDPAGAGQQSVWTYPRPAIADPTEARIVIEHHGQIVADTRAAIRTLETSHPPSYYIPRADIAPNVLRRADGSSFCEWKGAATYWDVVVGDSVLPHVGWSYANPTSAFTSLRDHIAFYAGLFDRCTVDGETATPQPGEFYGAGSPRASPGRSRAFPAAVSGNAMSGADDDRGRSIPRGRLSRLGQFGRLAGGVAGGMLAEGARRLAAGERPRMGDLILTPGNARRVTDRLSHLRGAAMKLGQMISLDAGDLLPPELSSILATLRDQAYRMPPAQLNVVLKDEWGDGWRRRFRHFDALPIAAASIGQVHRAILPDGRALAIKVQYPGVRDSIDSDIDNVATLLRVSSLLPSALDLAPVLTEAKRQLAEEADYRREGAQMRDYGARLRGDPRYVVPELHDELTTGNVLAMEYVEGRPIETLTDAAQTVRDAAMTALIELVLRELLEFGVMQTDPNFANFRWQPESGALVLLDFGATRGVPAATAASYLALIDAGLTRDLDRVREIAVETGFIGEGLLDEHRAGIDRIIVAIDEALNRPGRFDFANRTFVPVIRDEGRAMIEDRATWHVPDVETLFVQRKVSGTALLAARLKAQVDVKGLAENAVHSSRPPAAGLNALGPDYGPASSPSAFSQNSLMRDARIQVPRSRK